MKKRLLVSSAIAVSIVFIFFILPSISAYNTYGSFDLSSGANNLIQIVKDIFGPIFEFLLGVDQFSEHFFARILLLVIIYIISAITLDSLQMFKGKKAVIFIISAAIAIMGARYLSELNIMETILLPYGVVAIAISMLLPFIVFFFFVHKTMSSGLARRAAWIFFAVIFFGLWWTRKENLAEFGWIYNIGVVVTILAIIFDSKFHEYFGLAEAAEFKRGLIKKQIADIEATLQNYAGIQNPSRSTLDTIKHLNERRDDLAKKL